MQTKLATFIKDTPEGQEADRILRKCVHCGFCNATCPTYQLLGDELDGPRGRIYLLKQMLEGQPVSRKTQLHIDRCLSCMNCQTTCPSGVEYGKLLDIGRILLEQRVSRPYGRRWQRLVLKSILPYPVRFKPLLRLAQAARPLLSRRLRRHVPERTTTPSYATAKHARKVLMLEGCVQPALAPATISASAKVLDALEISIVPVRGAVCCGALNFHLGDTTRAYGFMKRNIDAWWPRLEEGAEAIITTASACGLMVKQYGEYLKHDPQYRDKAAQVAGHARDLCEILINEDNQRLNAPAPRKIAFHPPCTLQHGQKLNGIVEKLLINLGFELVPVADSHLCCGSAGTYSLLQPTLSKQLLHNKLDNLQRNTPSLIATANIGCQMHLQSKADVPVVHWIELLTEPKEVRFRR
jgi:glycolate oxidase iron-sulfur subunit